MGSASKSPFQTTDNSTNYVFDLEDSNTAASLSDITSFYFATWKLRLNVVTNTDSYLSTDYDIRWVIEVDNNP